MKDCASSDLAKLVAAGKVKVLTCSCGTYHWGTPVTWSEVTWGCEPRFVKMDPSFLFYEQLITNPSKFVIKIEE